ncbi:MAG TPA: PLDc N-terminal domain-containing protein [Croceibacterium sp.]|jgi:hypothetical protein|nr:PLDc N-terminal domain-containing protein [Croceibacterium sp.]
MLHSLFWILVVGLDIFAIYNVWKNSKSDAVKIGWLVGIVIFPILGFLVWLFAGPKDQKRLPRF